jgi:hypothetical protein
MRAHQQIGITALALPKPLTKHIDILETVIVQ